MPGRAKVCRTCKVEKSLTFYGNHKGYPDGKEYDCRDCLNYKARVRERGKKPQTAPEARTAEDLHYDPSVPNVVKKLTEQTPEAFRDFVERYWPEEPLPRHALDWVTAALGNRRLLLNVPPGHAKTSIMATRFSIWQIACNRDAQILIVSKTTKLGEKIARSIAAELEHNDRLIADFGKFRPPQGQRWSVGLGELMVAGKKSGTGDLSLLIRGSGQAILGFRADWIIADDVTDRAIAKSPTESLSQREWFVSEVDTRLKPDGKIFCIGQRVHSEDIYGWLAKKEFDDGAPVWTQIETPAVLDWDAKQVLWPEFWTWDRIMETRFNQGDADFNCYYQQNPALGGDYFREWWFAGNGTDEYPGCLDHERSVGQGFKSDDGDDAFPITRVIAVDPSHSPGGYCAMVVADVVYVHLGTEFWASVVDVRREHMGQRELLANVQDLWDKYRPQAFIIERNSQKFFEEIPEWNYVTSLFTSVINHDTGSNKNSDEFGVWSLASDVQAGRLRFPWGDPDSVTKSRLLIDEMLSYGVGRTNDVLMAMWLIKFNYRYLIPADVYKGEYTGRNWNMDSKSIRGAWGKEFTR